MRIAILALLCLAPQERVFHVSWAPPAQIDPQRATTLSESRCIAALFEGLTTPAADGVTPAPGMAEKWETSDDGRTWTFRLRDAKWSDGEPVVAGDFVFAWRRALRPETGCEFVNLFRVFRNVGAWLDAMQADSILAQLDDLAKGTREEALRTLEKIARKRHAAGLRKRGAPDAARAAEARPDVEEKDLGFVAADAKILRVTLEKRSPWLPDLLTFMSFAPVPPKAVAAHGESWSRGGRIVTNGPYLFDASTGLSIVFKKNPAYWDKALADAPGTVVVELSSEEVALEKFRAGKLDWLPREQIPASKLAEQKDLVAFDTWGTHFLRFNVGRVPFDKKEARVAIARSIDRREVAKAALARPAGRLVPSGFPGYPEVAAPGFDKAAAMEALLKATEFDLSKFPRVELLTNESPRQMAVGNAVADQIEKTLAVKVRVRSMKWPAYLKAMADGDYQIALGNWMGDYFDPAAFLEGWTKAGGGGLTGWSDESFDALVAESAGTADAKVRLGLLAKAEEKLLASAVVAPLHTAGDAYLLRDGVSGFAPNLLSRFPLKYVRIAAK